MFPYFATTYLGDQLQANTVVGRDLTQDTLVGADCAHLFIGEFCQMASLSAGKAVPSLPHLVGHVVVMCAKEKMTRIDTGRHVALVADLQPNGDCPAPRLPSDPVGELWPVLSAEHPVAAPIAGSEPQPTSGIRFGDAPSLKSLGYGHLVAKPFRWDESVSHDSTPIAVEVRAVVALRAPGGSLYSTEDCAMEKH